MFKDHFAPNVSLLHPHAVNEISITEINYQGSWFTWAFSLVIWGEEQFGTVLVLELFSILELFLPKNSFYLFSKSSSISAVI